MKSIKLLLTSLALSLFSSLACASDEGLYLGVNAISGQVKLEDITLGNTTYSGGDSNTFGGGLTAGINTSKNFAIETGLDGLNEVNYGGDNAPTRNYWFTYVAAKPMLDIWKFNTFVEVGAAYISYTESNHNVSGGSDGSAQVTPFFGAGFGFNINPNVELDLSINRIQDTVTPITFGMLTFTYHFITKYEDSGFLAD